MKRITLMLLLADYGLVGRRPGHPADKSHRRYLFGKEKSRSRVCHGL